MIGHENNTLKTLQLLTLSTLLLSGLVKELEMVAVVEVELGR